MEPTITADTLYQLIGRLYAETYVSQSQSQSLQKQVAEQTQQLEQLSMKLQLQSERLANATAEEDSE